MCTYNPRSADGRSQRVIHGFVEGMAGGVSVVRQHARGGGQAVARSPQQLLRDQLMTVRVLAQLWEVAVGKNADQIQGLSGRICPVELIAELLQRHPLHRLLSRAGNVTGPPGSSTHAA
jgi:hypothetical protein